MNSIPGHHDPRQQTFLLVKDLAPQACLLRTLGIQTPNPIDPIFTTFTDGLVSIIQRGLPQVKVHVIDMTDLTDRILAEGMRQASRLRTPVIVSTCPEIATRGKGISLEVCRIINTAGEIIGWGPRPGHPPIREQMESIKTLTRDGKNIVLVEDGAFTGGTLKHLLNEAALVGITISAIILGFIFPPAQQALQESYSGELIVTEVLPSNLLDWIPERDFVPLIPGSGRIVGSPFYGKHALPLYDHRGWSYTVPYLQRWCNTREWTGLDEDTAHSVTRHALEQATRLFDMIVKLNHKQLRLSDIISARLNVSAPIACDATLLPFDDFILRHLSQMAARVY